MASRWGQSSMANKVNSHNNYNTRTDNIGNLKLLFSKSSGHNRNYNFPVTITYKEKKGDK